MTPWLASARGRRSPFVGRYGAAAGFSLIELLNLLSLVVLLSAVGMVAVSKYIRHSKTAEAVSSVESIAKGAAAFYDKSDFNQPAGSKPEAMKAMRHFPPPSSAS